MDVAEQRVRLLSANRAGVERNESVGMDDEWSTLFWQEFWEEHGCAGPVKTGDYATLLHHAEMSRTVAYANAPMGAHLAELHTRRDRELRGEPNLAPRQWEVLRQVSTGACNTQIARTLGLSEATVRKHLENVFLRLGVQSRTQALARVHAFLDVA